MFATVRMVVMVKCYNSQNGDDGQVFATVRMMVMVKCYNSQNGGDGQELQQSE